MTKRLCWLDDQRDPHAAHHSSMITALLTDDLTERVSPAEIIWVKNYEEFIEEITQNGLPDILSLDRDLTFLQMIGEKDGEKTGEDCTLWLIKYCTDRGLKLPEITQCHSQNPAGKKNITTLLTNFRRQ